MDNQRLRVELLPRPGVLWRYVGKGNGERPHDVVPPRFEIDGQDVVALPASLAPIGEPRILPNGVREHIVEGPVPAQDGLSLRIVFRTADDNAIVRFRYVLRSDRPRRLTKTRGADRIRYASVSFADLPAAMEVRLSEFLETVHSYCPNEVPLPDRLFDTGQTVFGPIVVASDGPRALLVAYEHGSTVPDAFVQFCLSPDRSVSMEGVRGNYLDGQTVEPDEPFETIWMQLAAAADGGEDALADHFRQWLLRYMTASPASRTPFIFYNTWNYQERLQGWHGKRYLEEMHQDRMLAEIDVAHRMGIEVFVIDTGWYQKTGDWQVNRERFPDGLKAVKDRLDRYGMRLGLWFDNAAAVLSRAFGEHEDCVATRGGQRPEPHPIWETEASHRMCLVSRYWQAFADELIRLNREVGVAYFKWDAIGQWGCDDPNHEHGDASHTAQERGERYAFLQPAYLARIVERICAACPDAIVDFDMTESGRCFGLSFLSAGKFFLINNGPYYSSYHLPQPPDRNTNLFFYPGPARNWICRSPLGFDKWIPSVLLLTHYMPDDPAAYQTDSLASLILGQNGIWGDLPTISPEGVERFATVLARYRRVRDDITDASPVRTGVVGGVPEVHEKISRRGRGAVCLFTTRAGTYRYVTATPTVADAWCTEGASVERLGDGRSLITARFAAKETAKIVLFGAT